MKNEGIKKAIDEFILTRVNHIERFDSTVVDKALEKLTADVESLKQTFSDEQLKSFRGCENSFDMLIGEIKTCYYRAGFSDGVDFLFNWRGENNE